MGRPRKHSESKTITERVKDSNDRLRKAGGKIITVRLPPEAVERLDKLRKRWDMPKTMAGILVYFIMREPIRMASKPVAPGHDKRRSGTH